MPGVIVFKREKKSGFGSPAVDGVPGVRADASQEAPIQVDVLAVHEDGRIWIEGWARYASHEEPAQATVKTAAGGWSAFPLWRYRRPDVAEYLGLDSGIPFGFCGWLGHAETQGGRIELRVSDGRQSRSLHMAPTSGVVARDYVLEGLDVPDSAIVEALRALVIPMIEQEASRGKHLERDVAYSYGRDGTTCEVNVVVPLYGTYHYLRNIMQWASVVGRKDTLLTLVCDDPGLSDGLLRWLKGWNDRVYQVPTQLICHSSNAGFAAACNTGWRSVASKFTAFWNSDVFPTDAEDVLGVLKGSLESESVSAIAPVLLYPDGSIQHAGMEMTPYGPIEGLQLPEHLLKGLDPEFLPCEPFEASLLSGAFMMMRSSLLDSVGGMPENFGTGDFEDVLLSLRLKHAGRLLVEPRARLRHLEGVSLKRQGNRATMKTLARSLMLEDEVRSSALESIGDATMGSDGRGAGND